MIEKQFGDIRLIGHSRAGEESVVVAPELNLCFDIGLAPREALTVDYVCLTHGHADHAAGIHYYFSQRGFIGAPPGCVLAHPRLVEHLGRLMDVWTSIEGHPAPRKIVPIRNGEDYPIRRNLIVRAFDNNHGGPSIGFTAIEVKHKLRPDLGGLSQAQIVERKRAGETIDVRVEAPLVTYTGDTADGPFFDLPHVRDSRVIVIECTFFDADHVERARAGRHLHVQQMPDIFARLKCQNIVITHVTRRTAIGDAKRALERTVGREEMERVTFLMDRRARRGVDPHGDTAKPRAASESAKQVGAEKLERKEIDAPTDV